MSRLKNIREKENLTQEELSAKSGISVRTIQRIESGSEPKGYTLRILSETLGIPEKELLSNKISAEIEKTSKEEISLNYSSIKLINLSSLPFTIIPPLNIIIPLILMSATKQKNPITRQIISLQVLWTIIAPIVFMLGILMKIGNKFTLALIVVLVLSNVYIVLRNAASIDKNKRLHHKLDFSMI